MGIMECKTEEERVYWVTVNTCLNGLGTEGCGDEYNWEEEAIIWARGKDYFHELSWDEFLIMARKYDVWNNFEKGFLTKKE